MASQPSLPALLMVFLEKEEAVGFYLTDLSDPSDLYVPNKIMSIHHYFEQVNPPDWILLGLDNLFQVDEINYCKRFGGPPSKDTFEWFVLDAKWREFLKGWNSV